MPKNVNKIFWVNSVIPVKPPGINPEFTTKIFKFNAKRKEPTQTRKILIIEKYFELGFISKIVCIEDWIKFFLFFSFIILV